MYYIDKEKARGGTLVAATTEKMQATRRPAKPVVRSGADLGRGLIGGIEHSKRSPSAPVRKGPKRHRASDPGDFKTSVLQIRVKDELKADATKALDRIGISLPEAIRVFLGRIVQDQAFPFPLDVLNAETAAALRESIATDHKRYTSLEEMLDDLEKGGVR